MRVYFTVATCNYLGYVRALAAQLKLHEPDALFFVLLADRPESGTTTSELGFPVHYAQDFVSPEWFRQASYFYSAFELSNNLKPVAHRLAMTLYNASEWAYVDSDIQVLGPLDVLWQNDFDIILTPHRTQPFLEARGPGDALSLLRYGSANGGLLACRRSAASSSFVCWFEEALREHGFSEWQHSYVDQKWLDVVLAFFPTAGFCRYPGINVGHWNLNEHTLSRDKSGRVLFGGQYLLALHYSRWSPERWQDFPEQVGGVDPVIWGSLAKDYRDQLLEADWAKYRKMSYQFERDREGGVISLAMRRAYFQRRQVVCDPWVQSRREHRLAALKFLIRQLKLNSWETRKQIRSWFKLT